MLKRNTEQKWEDDREHLWETFANTEAVAQPATRGQTHAVFGFCFTFCVLRVVVPTSAAGGTLCSQSTTT